METSNIERLQHEIFRCVKFILSQFEHISLKSFVRQHAPPSPQVNGLRLTVEFTLGLENSWKSEGILFLLESGKTAKNEHLGINLVC